METLQSGICHQTRMQPGNQSLVIMLRPFSPRCPGSGSATQLPPGSSGWWECGPRCSGELGKLPGWRRLSRQAGGSLEDLSWPNPLETNKSYIFNTNRFIFVSRGEHNKCFINVHGRPRQWGSFFFVSCHSAQTTVCCLQKAERNLLLKDLKLTDPENVVSKKTNKASFLSGFKEFILRNFLFVAQISQWEISGKPYRENFSKSKIQTGFKIFI